MVRRILWIWVSSGINTTQPKHLTRSSTCVNVCLTGKGALTVSLVSVTVDVVAVIEVLIIERRTG